MATLTNDDDQKFSAGLYTYKTDGALDIQVQLFDEPFSTVSKGVIAGAETDLITLPECNVKCANAGANTLWIKGVPKFK